MAFSPLFSNEKKDRLLLSADVKQPMLVRGPCPGFIFSTSPLAFSHFPPCPPRPHSPTFSNNKQLPVFSLSSRIKNVFVKKEPLAKTTIRLKTQATANEVVPHMHTHTRRFRGKKTRKYVRRQSKDGQTYQSRNSAPVVQHAESTRDQPSRQPKRVTPSGGPCEPPLAFLL